MSTNDHGRACHGERMAKSLDLRLATYGIRWGQQGGGRSECRFDAGHFGNPHLIDPASETALRSVSQKPWREMPDDKAELAVGTIYRTAVKPFLIAVDLVAVQIKLDPVMVFPVQDHFDVMPTAIIQQVMYVDTLCTNGTILIAEEA